MVKGCRPVGRRRLKGGHSTTDAAPPGTSEEARPPNDRFTVGFVGRVCPIKDVKTLVYASRLVAEEVPDLHVRVMGPMDEDPEYAQECKDLIELLDRPSLHRQ